MNSIGGNLVGLQASGGFGKVSNGPAGATNYDHSNMMVTAYNNYGRPSQ